MIQNRIFVIPFVKILFQAINFFIFAHTFQCILSEFACSIFARESLKANKNVQKRLLILQYRNLTHITNLNSLYIKNNILLKRCQKPFSLYKFSSKHVSIWCQKDIFCNAPFLDL